MNRGILAIRYCFIIGLLMVGLASCGASKKTESVGEQTTGIAQQEKTPGSTISSTTDLTKLFEQGATEIPVIDLSRGVSGIGEVKAEHDSNLVFTVAGTVQEVYVKEGDVVSKGQKLAILDVRTFDYQIKRAEAGLVRAQAQKAALFEAPRPIDVKIANIRIRQAEAALAQAQAQRGLLFEQPKEADLYAANAMIRQSEANLAKVLAPPKEVDVRAAQAALDQAKVALDSARDQLSFQKTQAELQTQQSVYQLTQDQWKYALAQRYWEHADEKGTDPVQPATKNAMTGKAQENKLSGGQQASYESQYEQTKAAMQKSEELVKQAVLVAEQARKAETTGVKSAELQITRAQAALDKVLQPPDEHDVASAQAGLDLAKANRDKLMPNPNGSQQAQADAIVASAQAGLDLAIANRDNLNPNPTDSQQVQVEASIQDAEAALELAKLNREYAELRAPFDAVVSQVNIDPGDPSSLVLAGATNNTAIQVVNTGDIHIDVHISDVDISRVDVGQKATAYVDALPGKIFTGKVSYVSPNATIKGNITTYLVRIVLDSMQGLRPGMSVRVEIADKP